jgi:adenylate kinase
MKNILLTVLISALLAVSTSAFVPTPTSTFVAKTTKLSAKNELVIDTDFESVNIIRLLGLRRLRKKARKNWAIATASDSSDKSASTMKKALKIIIAGAPASGKGTQCEIIKKNYGVVHLSTGDMLRAAVAAGTDVGKAAKEYMDAGKLVPDEVIIGVVKDRLEQQDCKTKGWLLDGFPRTPAQAEALAAAGITADCFLFLNVPDEILVERVVGRRTDPETGKIYHMKFSPPTDETVLARLEQRSDDTEEKVKVRLEQVHANVDAVKGSYKDIGVDIDGTANPEEVSNAVSAAILSKISA